ncbi:hypothetical protein [Tardibacter chloracetimidivorans]|uniref:hypothetical protein n=1 Tax=Tardibacter chloracetimidivorans TaxID=1921510 RepID=UPI00130121C5|nr:hypothetical protein [Tardibacter chloracetimidivorans]
MKPHGIELTGRVAPHGGVSLREGLVCMGIGAAFGLAIALALLWEKGLLSW